MEPFFDRLPAEVASDLVGKTLVMGDLTGVITAALPRTARENERWLENRPLFGPNPVEAYAAPYRGSILLFLRTSQNTCVRIEAARFDQQVIKGPGRVAQRFGVTREMTGDVMMSQNDSTIIITWHQT